MSEQTPELDTPVEPEHDTTNPYTDTPVVDGVGVQDDEATEMDPEVGA